MKSLSLAILLTHPTQFDAPLFREISRTGSIDLEVYYLETDRIAEQVDDELGFSPNWDIPLLAGYKSVCCPGGFFERLRFLRRKCFAGRKYDLVIVPGYARLDVALLGLLCWNQALGMRLDTASIYPEPPWKAHAKRLILRQLFRRYRVFHPVGSLTESFLRELGIGPERMFRFPYAIDNGYFRAASKQFRRKRAALLQELRIVPESFVVLGVLKFVPRENPLELIQGFRLFHERNPKSALILVGAGPLEEEVIDLILKMGLPDAVRLVGYSKYSDLPRWYAVSDVFVHPSSRECWGVSVNEAMACGLPVVASDRVGSAYDLLEDGVNGYRYPGGDCRALAGCFERLARDRDRCRGMGEQSRRIIAEWDYRATIASLEAALASVTRTAWSAMPVQSPAHSEPNRFATRAG